MSHDSFFWKWLIFNGMSTHLYRILFSATITPMVQWHTVIANPSMSS